MEAVYRYTNLWSHFRILHGYNFILEITVQRPRLIRFVRDPKSGLSYVEWDYLRVFSFQLSVRPRDEIPSLKTEDMMMC
jgi:hypothetical protein